MSIFQRTRFDSTGTNGFGRSSMPMRHHVGEFTFRAGNRYLDIKTDLATESAMLSIYYWGYLYNSGDLYGSAGTYAYQGTSFLNTYIRNSGSTTFSSFYKTGAPYYVCLKFDRGSDGYSEGKINLFMIDHGLGIAPGVLGYAENNSASAYYN
jgi:hypothetical protein